MGEAKRRQQSAGADPGFDAYRERLKRDFPDMTDIEIAEGWMRQYSSAIPDRTPAEHPVPLSAVTVQLVAEHATFSGSIAPADVEAAVAFWTKMRFSRNDTKNAIISGLMANRRLEEGSGEVMTCAALWLAWNSEASPAVRRQLRQPSTLIYEISQLGGRDYNFRMIIGPAAEPSEVGRA
jgi:hypothetical protein